MNIRAFREKLSARGVAITREPNGSLFFEFEHGYRDVAWAWMHPPCDDDDQLDEIVARAICRDLRISPQDVGL